MKRIVPTLSVLWLLAGVAPADAQTGAAAPTPAALTPGSADAAPYSLPAALQLAVPRPVRAVSAALGLGAQRLALVIGGARVGGQTVLESAARDVQAVADLLRGLGFVVMVREDIGATEWRSTIKEYRERLQPGGLGIVYVAALGFQHEGQNLLLPRDALFSPGADARRRLVQTAVPLDELAQALAGSAGGQRLLVVDAAYRHALLAAAPPGGPAGLAEQKLPAGVMALASQALGRAPEPPAPAALPDPPPAHARDRAASAFARSLIAALATPRISGAEALRQTRRTLVAAKPGEPEPWLAGETTSNDEFAEAGLIDSLIPRTPEEVAREALRHGSNLGSRRAGEMSVNEVLQQNQGSNPARPPTEQARALSSHSSPLQAANAAGTAGSTAAALGSVASAVGTLAGVAGAAAAAAGAVKAAETLAVAQAARTGAGVAGSVLGNTASLAARTLGSSNEQPAQSAVQSAVQSLASASPAGASVQSALTPAAVSRGAAQAALAADAVAALLTAAPRQVPPADPTPSAATPSDPASPAPAGPADAVGASPSSTARAAAPAEWRTQRAGDRGERPVYQPRSNNFGYAEGDTFSYQVIDTWRGETTGRFTTAIEEVLGDGQLLADGGQTQMDAQGRVTRQQRADGSVSSFQPAPDFWWSAPKAGESRDLLFKESFRRADRSQGETEWKGRAQVGKLRSVDTPAGRFDVLPIESSGWSYERPARGAMVSTQWQRTVWYAPKLGHPVAIEIQESNAVGKLLKRERIELTHAQTARGQP